MAGLNSLLSDTQQTQTTLPSWYDAAQQQVVQQAGQAASAAPQLGQTVAQGAINTLQPGAQNPYTQAQNTLQQISSGAANPWIVDQATGDITPNVNTAMGGLFAAQQNQLNQVLPTLAAPTEAGAIGSGNFGSLRGQTAVDTAKTNALANLQAQQMTAALQNQQYGSQAAANLGTVAGQGITNQMNVGLAQQNAPFQNLTNYANLLAGIKAPNTVTQQTQMAPLTQAATIANTLQGTGAAGGLGSLLFGSAASGNPYLANGQPNPNYKPASGGLFGTGGFNGVKNSISDLFSGSGSGIKTDSSGNPIAGTYPTSDGGTITINSDGSKVITSSDGTVFNFNSQGQSTAPVLNPIPEQGLPPDTNPGNPDNPSPIPEYNPE
jgi:hypothetical protein